MSKFTIPSLAEIKAANKVSSKSEPSLFKASSRVSSAQPQPTASSSGTAAQSSGSCREPGHSAPTSAAAKKSGKIDKQVPSICLGNSILKSLLFIHIADSPCTMHTLCPWQTTLIWSLSMDFLVHAVGHNSITF